MTSPIADLSYRNYDGPLEPPSHRWWAIGRVAIQTAFQKKSFWVFTVLSGFWYVILMIIFYFAESIVPNTGLGSKDATNALFRRVNWDELFLHAFWRAQLWYFIIALLIGVGSIANDNRANALLVYLSKPCTKLDYIIGKWMGIFIPLTVATAIPTFFFYLYCLLSYRSSGFTNDPWLILRLMVLVLIPGIFHASLSIGVSSMFKQGRLAGATYAGIYFFSYFLTVAMGGINGMLVQQGNSNSLVSTAYYFSVDGIQIGLAKDILHVNGGQPLPFMPGGGGGQFGRFAVAAPNGLLFTAILLGLSAVFVLIAWTRVRAVEVVG